MTLVRSVAPLQEPSIRRERIAADSFAEFSAAFADSLAVLITSFSFFAIMISLVCKDSNKLKLSYILYRFQYGILSKSFFIFFAMKILQYHFFAFALIISLGICACSTPTIPPETDKESSSSKTDKSSSSSKTELSSKSEDIVVETGKYTSRDSVAAYLCKFDKLPNNYVGKNEGQKLYESSTGSTFTKWNFNPWKTLGVMIGGDSFSNSEKLLPDGTYHEADVDYGNVQSRGTKRLVYQTGCIIYYTADHYETFTRLEL